MNPRRREKKVVVPQCPGSRREELSRGGGTSGTSGTNSGLKTLWTSSTRGEGCVKRDDLPRLFKEIFGGILRDLILGAPAVAAPAIVTQVPPAKTKTERFPGHKHRGPCGRRCFA